MIHFAQGASELCYLDSAFLASCGSSLERRAAALAGAELAVHVKMFLSITCDLPGHKSPCRAVSDSVCTARERLKKKNVEEPTFLNPTVQYTSITLYCTVLYIQNKGQPAFVNPFFKYTSSLQLLHISVLPHLIS